MHSRTSTSDCIGTFRYQIQLKVDTVAGSFKSPMQYNYNFAPSISRIVVIHTYINRNPV